MESKQPNASAVNASRYQSYHKGMAAGQSGASLATSVTNASHSSCSARRCNDQYLCGRCGLQWDVTDTDPPRCIQAGELAIQQMRAMIAENKLRDPIARRKPRR